MTDANFWVEKPEFWKAKLNNNEVYARQRMEVRKDLFDIASQKRAKTFADIGGYDGRMGMGKVYDIQSGFDLTQDWDKQKFKPVDICFTSLTLICFSPEQVRHIMYQMYKHTRIGIYMFEEQMNPEKHSHEEKISDEYGGKWAYDWGRMFPEAQINVSEVNDRWIKIWKPLRK